MPQPGEELIQHRRAKLEALRQRSIDPYPPRYHRSHTTEEALALLTQAEKDAPQGESRRTEGVSVAGRITAMRAMGKAAFLDIRDGSGRIQLHLRRDVLGEEAYRLLDSLDLGDFLGAEGPLFRTRKGEPTLEANRLTLLTKSLRPLPEKWHGLQDVEQRFRQRYLDLIANPKVREVFIARSRIIAAIRRFLDGRGFLEVETPILVPVAAGAMARPFVTRHNALDRTLYLRIATELYLKRLIVGGFDKVYEIGRVFRNEGIDQNHNPDFTLLESYEAYADYRHVMEMVESMVSSVAQEVLGTLQITWNGVPIDLTPPWRRLSLLQEVHSRTGMDIGDYPDAPSLAAKMRSLGIPVEQRASRGRLLDKLVSATVEPHLTQPTFLLDYPVEMSPLAKRKPENPALVERFEGFIGGLEIANSFTELNDPIEQRERLQEQEALLRAFQEEEMDRLDEDFLLALEHGMPPTGGLGMGIDRLVMVLTGQPNLREVMLFPQMRERPPG
ncbi:MAG: lysine--tRNA ligase [Dehalococcoidia bacterium]|nr:lysine--tRNA ligase [Dehalococcoidia bacterium]